MPQTGSFSCGVSLSNGSVAMPRFKFTAKFQLADALRALGMKRGKRQNDEIHDVFDRHPVKQAANHRVLGHKRELAACAVINRGYRKSDKEMKDNAQRVSASAAVEGLLAEQTRSHAQWNARPTQKHGLREVQGSSNQAAGGDCLIAH